MKKSIKKVLALLLAGVVVFSLAGCAGNNSSEDIDDMEDITDDIGSIEEEISKMAEENSSVKVGKYKVPSESDFYWEDVDGGVVITEYTGTEKSVEIPSKLDGKDVKEIGSDAFINVEIVGVKLPDTVVKINDEAFLYCTTLVEVVFGDNVIEIGKNAFEGCSALSSVELNDGLEKIDEMAFTWTSSLKNIEIPQTVKFIERGAFCLSGLTKIEIPGSVEMLGVESFQDCEQLKNVVIKDGVKSIGREAFNYCTSLEKVEIPTSVSEIGSQVFNCCEKVTVYAPTSSYAETYAKDNGVEFKAS